MQLLPQVEATALTQPWPHQPPLDCFLQQAGWLAQMESTQLSTPVLSGVPVTQGLCARAAGKEAEQQPGLAAQMSATQASQLALSPIPTWHLLWTQLLPVSGSTQWLLNWQSYAEPQGSFRPFFTSPTGNPFRLPPCQV